MSGGSHVGPSLNLVEQFETVDGQVRPLKTVAGETEPEPTDPIEELKSTDRYVVYDSPSDLFADRDPRLEGTILVPGSSFRNQELQLWAGLAIKHSETSWEFKHIAGDGGPHVGRREQIPVRRPTDHRRDGPHISFRSPNPEQVTGTGFLLRKYVDSKAGSE